MSIFSLSIFNRILLCELGEIDCAYRIYGNGEISCWKSFGAAHWISPVRYGRNHFIKTKDADRKDFFDPRRETFPRARNRDIAFFIDRRAYDHCNRWRHRTAFRERRSFEGIRSRRLARCGRGNAPHADRSPERSSAIADRKSIGDAIGITGGPPAALQERSRSTSGHLAKKFPTDR